MKKEEKNEEVFMVDKNSWSYPVFNAAKLWFERNSAIMEDSSFFAQLASVKPKTSVEVTSEPTFSAGVMEIMGYAKLENDADEEQRLTTGEYSKTIETNWSTTATNTRTFGMELEYKATFGPKIFQSELRVEYHMEFSHSQSESKGGSESITYTLPGQTISVPPRSTRYVYAFLKKAKAEGTVDLLVDTVGRYRSTGRNRISGTSIEKSETIAALVKELSGYLPDNELKALPEKDWVRFKGAAKYALDAAFQVNIKVTDKPLDLDNDGKVLEEYWV